VKSMKEAGAEEVRRLRKRAIRSLAMERIFEEDCKYIVKRCDELEARIQQMWEMGREEFSG